MNESGASNTFQRNLREISEKQRISPLLSGHLEQYFANLNAETFTGDLDALHGAAIQHARLGQERQSGEASIALYTPDFDRHGWHSPHTVIDIVTDDMPFLVDSVTMAIYNRGLTIHRLIHPILGVTRDAAGVFQKSAPCDTAGTRPEAWMHLEIDRIGGTDIDDLRAEIISVLTDIRAAVDDFAQMRESIETAIGGLDGVGLGVKSSDNEEIAEFLRWASNDNFIFMGYAHYHITDGTRLTRAPDGGLGLLRRADHPRFGYCRAGMPDKIAELEKQRSALTLTKADVRSIVHHPGYLDYIGVRERDANGAIVGEHVFIGLYAAHVYHISTSEIPIVRRKLAAVRDASGFVSGGHSYKTLRNILETYPRDELFEIDVEVLKGIAYGIAVLYEHQHQRARVFLRNDYWKRYVSVLVYIPRDRFETSVRLRIMELLRNTLRAGSVDFSINTGESRLVRLHLIVRTPEGADYDAEEIENGVARIVRGWQDELQYNLIEYAGEERGNALMRRYGTALPLAYQAQVLPSSAVSDLERIEAADNSGCAEIKVNAPYGDDGSHQHIKLFLKGEPLPLSSVLPVFENLGLTVLSEQPFKLNDMNLHIADFAVRLPCSRALEDEATRNAFVDLLGQLLRNNAENDGFNRLCLLAGLNAPRIGILRAYGRYLRQAGLPFSQVYVERCLSSHPQIARLLSDLFQARFDPGSTDAQAEAVTRDLDTALDQVTSLDDDRILSGYRTAFLATVRTNAWQKDANGQPKGYLSFKISSKLVPFLPKPVPLYEIFVYNPRMEGIHIRGARVARGGLRWSDRMEDYRAEGIALVKAQMVKNVVGVPLGAKGCFVGKCLPPPSERDAWLAEGIACYRTFIRGLLDITDNLVAGKVVPPRDVRRHDDDDPYLVVAADKGTATFSDIANAIAIEYGFWLGDAFASGGSVGYDHKHMGITSRGAWESVKRHFRELGRDTQTEPFTVVGIGDMSGDVFGNGLLRSEQIQLLAAFDHRHIFLDPNPDPARSFAERKRLFDLPRSSWDDYNKSLISEGGSVWPRSAMSVPLSPQIRARLGIEVEHIAPNDLISAILKAPVDLFFNGGIGTYVKASTQSQLDANDRTNDAVRVNANELRAKVVGEGGNLGFTQNARIEYALNGGMNYTDAIDNSAGVSTSDHEVNIKILTSILLQSGDMTMKQRDAVLASATEEVGLRVLVDNYQQTQAVSLETAYGKELLGAHGQLLRALEASAGLDRAVEFLPDDKRLLERAQMGRGLTTPEIAVLLAYTKIALKQAILGTQIPDAPVFQPLLLNYFPAPIAQACGAQIPSHPLRREIITTKIVSRLVNRMGTTFTQQLGDETGDKLERIIAAWYAASELLNAEALWQGIEALDLKLPAERQMALMMALRELVGSATRQILASQKAGAEIVEIVEAYRDAVVQAVNAARSGKEGVDAIVALLDARNTIAGVFELVDLARSGKRPLEEISEACVKLDASFDLAWFGNAISNLPAGNRWQARARARLTSDLRALRQTLLQRGGVEPSTANAARSVIEELQRNAPQDLAMLSAGLAEIRGVLLD